MAKTVVGLFNSASEARSTVHELVRAGVQYTDIGVMAPIRDTASADLMTDELVGLGNGSPRQVGLVVLVPGLGLMIAAGPIIDALRARRVHEGMLDTLTELGVPEEHVFFYADGLRRGGTLLSIITARAMIDQVTRVVNVHRPDDVSDRVSPWRDSLGCDDLTASAGGDVNAPPEPHDTLVDLFIDQGVIRRS